MNLNSKVAGQFGNRRWKRRLKHGYIDHTRHPLGDLLVNEIGVVKKSKRPVTKHDKFMALLRKDYKKDIKVLALILFSVIALKLKIISIMNQNVFEIRQL